MPEKLDPLETDAPVDEEVIAPNLRRRDDDQADEMGCASFPASDPPATWTWDPR